MPCATKASGAGDTRFFSVYHHVWGTSKLMVFGAFFAVPGISERVIGA
jgi:hypothetical protein